MGPKRFAFADGEWMLGSSSIFWRSLDSAPNHEFEELVDEYAVIQELISTELQTRSFQGAPWFVERRTIQAGEPTDANILS